MENSKPKFIVSGEFNQEFNQGFNQDNIHKASLPALKDMLKSLIAQDVYTYWKVSNTELSMVEPTDKSIEEWKKEVILFMSDLINERENGQD
jgi:hypothetical protein